MLIPIDEVVHFDCITSDPETGAVSDADSTPTFAVYEEATDTDIGVGGNLTKRTSLTGNYRGSFTASAANGFEAGKWYSVIVSATVNAIAGKDVARSFRCVPAESAAGVPKVDMSHLGGSSQSATDLQDFADAGYDPATNKVQGVVLVDTTTNSTNAPSSGDFTATMKTSIGTAVAASAVASVTGNVGGNVTGSVGSVVGAVGSVTGNVGGNVSGSVGSVVGAVGSVTGNIGGNVTGSVGSVTAGVTVSTNNDKTGYSLSVTPPTAAAIADAVWDEAISGHDDAGSTGEALAAAGSAGDPWTTALPGTYTAGQAGYIVGTGIPNAIAAVPTVEEIDTELSDTHGAGSWEGGAGGGGGNTTVVPVDRPVLLQSVGASEAVTFAFVSNSIVDGVETPTNITSLTLVLYVNNVVTAVVVSSSNPSTGNYSCSFTTPSDIEAGDSLYVKATGTISGTSVASIVWNGMFPTEVEITVDEQEIANAVADALSGHSVIVQSPINNRSGRLTIAAGDDYTDESGTSFNISRDDSTLPDLSGATFVLTARPKDYPDATPIVGTGTFVSKVGNEVTVKIEIPKAQTANGREYASEDWWYDLQATLPDGTVRTIKGPQAPCTVLLDQTQ